MEARGGGAAPWFLGARSSPGSLSFLRGKDPRTPFPSLHSPGTQIHRGLVSPPAIWAPSVYYLESNFYPHCGEGRGNRGGGGGCEVGGGNPDQTPDPSPNWSPGHLPCWAKEDFVRSLRAPGGGGWEQQERAGGSLLPRPSVRPSVPQATALSLESTLPSKGCSTPLWERRDKCSPGSLLAWARPGVHIILCPRHLAQVPATGHAGTPEPAQSSHCTAFPLQAPPLSPLLPSTS